MFMINVGKYTIVPWIQKGYLKTLRTFPPLFSFEKGICRQAKLEETRYCQPAMFVAGRGSPDPPDMAGGFFSSDMTKLMPFFGCA